MPLAFYLSGTSTLADTHGFTATAGTPSSAWAIDLWLNKGTAGGVASNVRLGVEVYSGGAWVASGHPALERHQFRARCTGFYNPGNDPLFVSSLADWTAIGAGVQLSLPALRGNCAHALEVDFAPALDTSAASGTFTWRLVLSYDENVEAAGVGVSEAGGIGILTGVGDPRISEWVEGPTVTESGTPDAYVQVFRRWCVLKGVSRRWLATAVELDQFVGGVALGPGEAYIGIITAGASGLTLTKGARAALASVVASSAPAGELPVARVVVVYQAGGTSVISNADITAYGTNGRGKVTATTGLGISVARLRAATGRALVTRSISEPLTVPDDATTTVWLTDSGAVSLASGVIALASVTAASGSVTSITDLRTYLEPGMIPIPVALQADEGVASEVDRAPIPFRWCLDRVAFSVLHPSTGATGSTIANLVKWSGGSNTDVFQSSARPAIAAQATLGDNGYPTVTTGEAGDWLTLTVEEITSGGTRAFGVGVTAMVYPLRGLAT